MNRILIIAALALAALTGTAQASANNALQPANVYFGVVHVGEHPTATITVTNRTGRNQFIRGFGLAGAGGGEFTNTWATATCRIGLNLRNGESCTIVVRVISVHPEFIQSVQEVRYGPRLWGRPLRGQWNGAVYAHVVA